MRLHAFEYLMFIVLVLVAPTIDNQSWRNVIIVGALLWAIYRTLPHKATSPPRPLTPRSTATVALTPRPGISAAMQCLLEQTDTGMIWRHDECSCGTMNWTSFSDNCEAGQVRCWLCRDAFRIARESVTGHPMAMVEGRPHPIELPHIEPSLAVASRGSELNELRRAARASLSFVSRAMHREAQRNARTPQGDWRHGLTLEVDAAKKIQEALRAD